VGRLLRRRWPGAVAGPRPEALPPPPPPQVLRDLPPLRRRWDFRPSRPIASRMEWRAPTAMETSTRLRAEQLPQRRRVEEREGPRARAAAERESRPRLPREDPPEVQKEAVALEEGKPRPTPVARQKRGRPPVGPRPTLTASRAGVPGITIQQAAGPKGPRRLLLPVHHSFLIMHSESTERTKWRENSPQGYRSNGRRQFNVEVRNMVHVDLLRVDSRSSGQVVCACVCACV
jgi:hypothetical protein